jgi:septum formation inhibitor-activating ATPase MinD
MMIGTNKKYDEKNKKDKKTYEMFGKKKYVDECKQNVYDYIVIDES